MNIALDMMGGDFAPEELVKGVRDYISEKTPAKVSLIGDEQQLLPLLAKYNIPAQFLQDHSFFRSHRNE